MLYIYSSFFGSAANKAQQAKEKAADKSSVSTDSKSNVVVDEDEEEVMPVSMFLEYYGKGNGF